MFAATDTGWAPWHVVKSDDKKRAPQRHQSPAQPDSVQGCAAGKSEIAEAAVGPGLPGAGLRIQVHLRKILT